ncbi:hypothetical protein JTE90_009354 [Oedothorax gibbosus]|uniref:Uncharacterized protein n=1 Tax=Oedothorax gibbosus TaxID=931172 RepID=A0AAV6VS47_9ARAC|nr:hypothetical protein JTE90_009354 [Oedothorax gibbosus]
MKAFTTLLHLTERVSKYMYPPHPSMNPLHSKKNTPLSLSSFSHYLCKPSLRHILQKVMLLIPSGALREST